MKLQLCARLRTGILTLMLVLVSVVTVPTANALFEGVSSALGNVSGALGGLSAGIQSIGAAVQIGTSLISDVLGLFGGGGSGGGSGAYTGGGVPNVPNGNILAGPGNASFGVSYVRDVFLPNLTNWLVSAILAGSVIVVLAGGIMFIVSNGNQETSSKAREAITWGILGVVVSILAYAIVRIVITINYLG